MQFIIKSLVTLILIISCVQIGRKVPSLAGLIAVMPLTGAIVMLWLYSEEPGNFTKMISYSKAALLGIVPSILFFLMAFICFRKHLPLWVVFTASFGAWFAAAILHQWFLNK